MTGWIIAGAVVAFLLILLMIPVRVRFEYSDELRLRIRWLFITLVRIPAVKRKMKRRDKKVEKDAEAAAKTAAKAEEDVTGEPSENAEEKPDKDGSIGGKNAAEKEKPAAKPKGAKLTLNDIFALVRLVWGSLGKPLRRLLKATRINGFRLRVIVGGDDAAATAIKFGGVNAAAGSAMAFLDGCFTLRKPVYDISCDFMSEETYTECEFTAKLSVIAALAFLFWVLGRLVKNYISDKDAAKAVGKLRQHRTING